MQVRIVEKRFGGVEFAPEMKVLHLGGQSSANVERLEFTLPESWQGKSVTLHIQRQDGTLPAPILLDEAHSCAVGKEGSPPRTRTVRRPARRKRGTAQVRPRRMRREPRRHGQKR